MDVVDQVQFLATLGWKMLLLTRIHSRIRETQLSEHMLYF